MLTLTLAADELKLAKAAHQSCVPSSTLDSRLKEREDAHQAALQKERDDLSRVKLELEKMRSEKVAAETALAEERKLRAVETQKLKETLDETEQRADSVEQQLDELKLKPAQWLSELQWVNDQMASKFPLSFIPLFRPTYALCRPNSNLAIALVGTEHFPQSDPVATTSVKKSRRQQIKLGPISTEWSIDDHLLALRSRISPLRVLGVDLLSAAIRAHSVLWPDSEATKSVAELAACLLGSEAKLREWRHSSARAGADEALAWVLSWYDRLDLDTLKTQREGSRWVENAELVQQRQERAYEIARWANTREYIDGPNFSDGDEDEEEQVEDSAGEEGAADSEADSEEEAVDATIEIDQAPSRTTTSPADTTDDSLKLAAEIGAKAAAEVSTSPTAPGTDAA